MISHAALNTNPFAFVVQVSFMAEGAVNAYINTLPSAVGSYGFSNSDWQAVGIALGIGRRRNHAKTSRICIGPEELLAFGDLEVQVDVVGQNGCSLRYPVERIPIRLRPSLIQIDDRTR